MGKLAINGGERVRKWPWPEWPVFDDADQRALLDVFRSGQWWQVSFGAAITDSGDAPDPDAAASRVAQFQRAFARAHDCAYGIAAANGTVTLEIGLRALGILPGDEVIVPAYTFIATASAPLMVDAIPVFVDIEPDTYAIDPARIEAAITPRTRAIIPVHFGGQPCDMDAITALARKHNLKVFEDAAHAHGAAYQGRACGSLGDMGSFSFQASKNMTAGEGGILTTNDRDAAARADSLVWGGREHGTEWYRHVRLGSNARLTEFQAAILLAQLARLADQTEQRMANARVLDELLGQIEGITPTVTRSGTTRHAYHLYLLRYDPAAFGGVSKAKFVAALAAEGISGVSTGYGFPLYKNPMFAQKQFRDGAWPVDLFAWGRKIDYGAFAGRCPVSERACASEAVWLPQNLLLADERGMHDIARAVQKIQDHAGELAGV